MMKRINKLQVFQVAFSAVAAVLFVLFLSFSTSPLYGEYYGGDSAQFQTVGKVWADGGVPYRDAFDHKGPIIFLVNAIGYGLTGSKVGVAAIQMICTFATLVAIFKICGLVSKKSFYGVIGVILTLLFLSVCYTDGNMTEEYCLPFIAVSLYGLVKYFIRHSEKKTVDHPPLWAGVYGLCFGVCLMTQASNALSIGMGVLVITAFLIYKKQWGNLLRNIGYCLAGASIVVLPFIVYFATSGAFGEFIYGVIGYNSEYATNMSSWIRGATGNLFLEMGIVLLPSYAMLLVAYLAWKRGERLYSGFLIICGLMEMVWFCTGASFAQYEMITVPQIVLLLNELVLMKKSSDLQVLKMTVIAILTIICFNQIQTLIRIVPDNYHAFNQQTENSRDAGELIGEIPTEERDSFVTYGGNSLKDIYVRYDLIPYYKYFAIQDWHGKFSNKVKNEIQEMFSSGDVKWILADDGVAIINGVLEDRYELSGEKGIYKLYHLKTYPGVE